MRGTNPENLLSIIPSPHSSSLQRRRKRHGGLKTRHRPVPDWPMSFSLPRISKCKPLVDYKPKCQVEWSDLETEIMPFLTHFWFYEQVKHTGVPVQVFALCGDCFTLYFLSLNEFQPLHLALEGLYGTQSLEKLKEQNRYTVEGSNATLNFKRSTVKHEEDE